MNSELIYPNKESMSGGVSPFDRVIKEMVRQQDVQIICPYIGLDYFEGIINLANSWRLITDIQEWLFYKIKRIENE